VLDVDGNPGLELLLGAPYAAAPAGGSATIRYSGKVLAFPLSTLAKGSIINKPASSLYGAAKSDVLGAGLATWNLPMGQALVAFSGRASSEGGAFTGRVDLFQRAGASLTDWTRSGVMVPAKPSVERFGESLAVT